MLSSPLANNVWRHIVTELSQRNIAVELSSMPLYYWLLRSFTIKENNWSLGSAKFQVRNPALLTTSSCHYCILFWMKFKTRYSTFKSSVHKTKKTLPTLQDSQRCNCFNPYHQTTLVGIVTVKHGVYFEKQNYCSLQALLTLWLFWSIPTATSVSAAPVMENHWGTHWFCSWAEDTTSTPPLSYIIL